MADPNLPPSQLNSPNAWSLTGLVQALGQIAQALGRIATVLGNSYIALAGTNVFTGHNSFQNGLTYKVRVVQTSGTVVVTTADYIVAVNKTVAANTAVSLPASPSQGDTYVLKDDRGDANTHNITITPASGNIDGSSTYVISTSYGAVWLTYEAVTPQWMVMASR